MKCPNCGHLVISDRKSNRQNRYYRGVVVPSVKTAYRDIGYDFSIEEVHHILAQAFFCYYKKGIKFIKSTQNKNYTTDEWEEAMERIRRWCAEELDYIVPLPNERALNDI